MSRPGTGSGFGVHDAAKSRNTAAENGACPLPLLHADTIDAIFAKVKDQVEIQPLDKEKGQFVLRFLPLKSARGFNLGRIGHPIADAPPKGLGLKIIPVSKLAPKTPVRKARKR